jgi:hypothetical protein
MPVRRLEIRHIDLDEGPDKIGCNRPETVGAQPCHSAEVSVHFVVRQPVAVPDGALMGNWVELNWLGHLCVDWLGEALFCHRAMSLLAHSCVIDAGVFHERIVGVRDVHVVPQRPLRKIVNETV